MTRGKFNTQQNILHICMSVYFYRCVHSFVQDSVDLERIPGTVSLRHEFTLVYTLTHGLTHSSLGPILVWPNRLLACYWDVAGTWRIWWKPIRTWRELYSNCNQSSGSNWGCWNCVAAMLPMYNQATLHKTNVKVIRKL